MACHKRCVATRQDLDTSSPRSGNFLLHSTRTFPSYYRECTTAFPPSNAFGGAGALEQLQNISNHIPDVYRSSILTWNSNFDCFRLAARSRNISSSFVGGHLYHQYQA